MLQADYFNDATNWPTPSEIASSEVSSFLGGKFTTALVFYVIVKGLFVLHFSRRQCEYVPFAAHNILLVVFPV